jgi:hypothetical protein
LFASRHRSAAFVGDRVNERREALSESHLWHSLESWATGD